MLACSGEWTTLGHAARGVAQGAVAAAAREAYRAGVPPAKGWSALNLDDLDSECRLRAAFWDSWSAMLEADSAENQERRRKQALVDGEAAVEAGEGPLAPNPFGKFGSRLGQLAYAYAWGWWRAAIRADGGEYLLGGSTGKVG